MAVYAITGKLGSGKGKAAIQRIREYLKQGKRVATNCDLFLDNLLTSHSRASVIRIPDKPSVSDLYAIGSGNKFIDFQPIMSYDHSGYHYTPPSPRILEGFDESHNGALILDECASWLNTRNFQDKGRAGLLEWAIHARKYGWDIYFVCQNIKQIDSQLRESLFEYVVRLNRLDRMKVPFLSSAVKLLTAGYSDGSLPRMHIGVVRIGSNPDGLVADRWVFRGDDLNNAYNTTQVFSDSYPHAIHSLLPAWHLSAVVGIPDDFIGPAAPDGHDQVVIKPRTPPPKPLHKHMTKFLVGSMLFGMLLGGVSAHIIAPHLSGSGSTQSKHTYSETLTATGYYQMNGSYSVILSDGRVIAPRSFHLVPGGFEAQLSADTWVKNTK